MHTQGPIVGFIYNNSWSPWEGVKQLPRETRSCVRDSEMRVSRIARLSCFLSFFLGPYEKCITFDSLVVGNFETEYVT